MACGWYTSCVADIVIITPLGHEASALRKVLSRHGLTAHISGLGPEAIKKATLKLIGGAAGEVPRLMILAGLAGGLKPAQTLPRCGWGTTIVDATGNPVRGRAKSLVGCSWPALRITSIAEPICFPDGKRELAAATDADYGDTESFWFAQTCADNDVPWAVIRAVSDDVDEILPPAVLKWTTPEGKTDPAQVIKDMFRHPSLIGKAMRLGSKSKHAMGLIAAELDKVLPHVVGKRAGAGSAAATAGKRP